MCPHDDVRLSEGMATLSVFVEAWICLWGPRQLSRIAEDSLCDRASQPNFALCLMQTLLRELPTQPLNPAATEPLAAAVNTLCGSPLCSSGEAAFAAAAHSVVRACPGEWLLRPRATGCGLYSPCRCCDHTLGSQVEGLDDLAVLNSSGGHAWTTAHSISHCALATSAGFICAQQPALSIAHGLLPPLTRLATSRTSESSERRQS